MEPTAGEEDVSFNWVLCPTNNTLSGTTTFSLGHRYMWYQYQSKNVGLKIFQKVRLFLNSTKIGFD